MLYPTWITRPFNPDNESDQKEGVIVNIAFVEKLLLKGVTLLCLWEDYQVSHPEGFKMTAFYNHYKLWKGRVQPSMHISHKAETKCLLTTREKN